LERHRDRLPEIVIPVLEVGEVSGTLEAASRRLAEAFEKAGGIQRKYRFAVFDPKLIIALAVLQSVIFGFAPYFLGTVWIAFQTLVRLLAIYLIARVVLKWLNRNLRFRMAIDTVKLALPHAGTIARNLAAARWGRSFATLWHAGVPVSEALEVSSRSALNAHFEEAMMLAARRTREGWSVADSLAATPLLPKYLVDILKTGETAGDFGAVLDRFVVLLENEALSMATQELAGAAVAMNLLLAYLVVATLGK
jgi:type IV pilus assembly protein PilC